ncbi:hypothetical protein LEMLEM_LOCUS10393 [Lemmus lemmus]
MPGQTERSPDSPVLGNSIRISHRGTASRGQNYTRKLPSVHALSLPPLAALLRARSFSVVLSSLQPEAELQEDSPEIYRLAPNLESLVVINSRLLSRLLSPVVPITDCLPSACHSHCTSQHLKACLRLCLTLPSLVFLRS